MMPDTRNLTVDLPAADADDIDAQVAAGTCASDSDVVREGLRARRDHDAALDVWLRDDVEPVYDTMVVDPHRALAADEVLAAVRARRADRLTAPKREA